MERFKNFALGYGIELDERMLDCFQTYMDMLLDWNGRMNLTAITEPKEIIVKHFLDSLLVLMAVDLPQGATVIDVGTGAGFPGIPLKIVRPDLQLTLLDSLNKRVQFLEAVSQALHQDNKCIHGRAEDVSRMPDHRECYDVSLARAVASLPALSEYCVPFVKTGGRFLALKGYEIQEELSHSKQAFSLLGGEFVEVKLFSLPMENKRSIVNIKKISRTPPQYPRKSVKIAKAPLQ